MLILYVKHCERRIVMRSERFSTLDEIKKYLSNSDEGAGVGLLYDETKRIYYHHKGEGHVCVLGVPGSGKTSTFSLSTAYDIIAKGESMICIDPKGDIFEYTYRNARKTHDTYVIDLRNPCTADGINLLKLPFELYRSNNPAEKTRGIQMLNDMANTLYPIVNNEEPYWKESSRNYFVGCAILLFENCKSLDEVNIASLIKIMQEGEERDGGYTVLKRVYDLLPDYSRAKIELSGYCLSPAETRMSTYAVARAGVKHLFSSEAISDLLSANDMDIAKLDGKKPCAIYIILPDETSVYSNLAALLISQLMTHYIQLAENTWHHRLPTKLHLLLEELGNIAPIPDFSYMMGASRSRNIRIYAVLQSYSQLKAVYGDKANAIKDCFDITTAFRCYSYETLKELSDKCGVRSTILHDTIITEPLISPSQLGALTTRQCLIIISGRFKYITSLPFADDVYKTDRFDITSLPNKKRKTVDCFEIKALFEKLKQEKIRNTLNDIDTNPFSNSVFPPLNISTKENDENIEELIRRIDEKIALIEEEEVDEEAEKKRKLQDSSAQVTEYVVKCIVDSDEFGVIVRLLDEKNIKYNSYDNCIQNQCLKFHFNNKETAEKAVKLLINNSVFCMREYE